MKQRIFLKIFLLIFLVAGISAAGIVAALVLVRDAEVMEAEAVLS